MDKQAQMDAMWEEREGIALDWERDVHLNAYRAYARGNYASADLDTLRHMRNDAVADLEETRMDWVPLERFRG